MEAAAVEVAAVRRAMFRCSAQAIRTRRPPCARRAPPGRDRSLPRADPGTSYACTPRTAPCARPGRSPRPEQDSVSRSLDRLASSRQSALIKTDPSTSMNRWRAQLEGIRPLDASLAIGQTGKRINGFRPRDIGEPVAAMVSVRSEEHTSELQSLMRISYAVFCLTKTK